MQQSLSFMAAEAVDFLTTSGIINGRKLAPKAPIN